MFMLNQIVGIGSLGIIDNLRLIVIIAIFIGIIIVLLYRRFTKSGRKTNGKYMRATNPYDSSSKEKRHSADVVDDFMSIEEEIKAKKDGNYKATTEPEVEIEEKSVVSLETIEENIKNIETQITAKFAEVIKDVKGKITAKFTTEMEEVKAEFTTRIEALISKMEEREKDVVNKIERRINSKVQETLKKMDDRVSTALQSQKNSTASVLEKLVDSLRTVEVPADDMVSEETQKAVEEKVNSEEVGEKDFWNTLKETPVKDKGEIGDSASSLQADESPDNVMPSDESKCALPEEIEVGGAGEKTEVKEDTRMDEEEPIPLQETRKEVPEKVAGDLGEFDMQEFLDEVPVSAPTSGKAEAVVEEEGVVQEEELEVQSEEAVDVKLEAKETIVSPQETGGKVPEKVVADSADLDIQEFLDEVPVDASSSEEPKLVAEEEEVASEEIKEGAFGVPSEDKAGVNLEKKESITSPGKDEEEVLESTEGDSADFDIQEFLDELESLPSENDPETEK